MILKIQTEPGSWVFYDGFHKIRHFYINKIDSLDPEFRFSYQDEKGKTFDLAPDIVWEWTFNSDKPTNWIGINCRRKFVGEDEVLLVTNSPFCYLLNDEGRTIEKIN